MSDKIYDKTQAIQDVKTSSRTVDIILIISFVMAILTFSIWMSLFLTFGKNIEVYKDSIKVEKENLKNKKEEIAIMDEKINKYVQILSVLEKK